MTTKYRPITAITELQVPQGLELDAEQWAGYFQPLVHAEGHRGTVWGRSQKEPGVVLLVTLWGHPDELRDFQDSPCAQLFRESLLAVNALQLSYHEAFMEEYWFPSLEMAFVQFYWVYLPAAMTPEQETRKPVAFDPPSDKDMGHPDRIVAWPRSPTNAMGALLAR
ncbi:uncharacterized protein BO95DRAFT_437188 [Aspergillus brunneoviolaceus CBS 621.78]|uniref:Uncharacterized protein n=1 Tax=Aspergillus brunneoviolaceus CBS 621.78 TaxID=1450534 RepID=A0ACD1FS95_9EURO|nr:hypothetical protein BO95DRAFT_437188 [Aspergillus brunneoviolaceus CBS 621.78]RAH39861.1 hypothetical protein BO95DRAFT_437188 [Aspergillus brunneoviolaceus CBS 621.78]